MKRFLIITLLIMQLIGCTNSSSSESNKSTFDVKMELDTLKEDDVKINNTAIFQDQGLSTFEILSGDANSGYDYQVVETNYSIKFLTLNGDYSDLKNYLLKQTSTTRTCTGCESQEKNIKIELSSLDSPGKTLLEIEKECDIIFFDAHTFKTINYGCCGSEDEIEIFDYQQNSIIKGHNEISLGSIPNSDLKFYVAFEQDQTDSDFIGTLIFSYGSKEKFLVRIKTPESFNDYCTPFSPEVTLIGLKDRDRYSSSTNEYTLWSLDGAKSKNRVTNFSVNLSFDCDGQTFHSTIEVPIVSGTPNGKNTNIQIVEFSNSEI